MARQPFPLVILGGRDRRATILPENGQDKHPLQGYKAVDTRIGDQALIEVLVERLARTGAFAPIYIAGPRLVYERLGMEVEIIDTDGELGQNLRAALGALTAESWPHLIGFTTCDILATDRDLETALDDLESREPFHFWFAQCRVPEDRGRLGSSAWKPRYHIRPEDEPEPVATLPGHLLAVDPRALRLKLLYRFFDLAYRTRNRPLRFRRAAMTRHLLWVLVVEDIRRIFSLRFPNITWLVALSGLAIAAKLRARSISQQEMEDYLTKIFVRNEHRRGHPERRGWMPILDVLSLARDIDTEEEALEITGSLQLPAQGD